MDIASTVENGSRRTPSPAPHCRARNVSQSPDRRSCEVTERIRIIRRLDFTQAIRVEITYDEHSKILRAILQRRADDASLLLRAHIEAGKAEVRKITLHCLHTATRAPSRMRVPG